MATFYRCSFNLAGQRAFAELSGDYNPIHLDSSVARRSLFGGVVVHGINLLLTAIDRSVPQAEQRIQRLRAVFYRPVIIDREVQFNFSTSKAATTCTIESEGILCCRLQYTLTEPDEQPHTDPADAPWPETQPADEDVAVGFSASQPLTLDRELGRKLYPHLITSLSVHDIATLLATTFVVGMRCPGLRSIYSELRLESRAQAAETLTAECTALDERYDRATLELTSHRLSGSAIAYVRPAPVEQPGLEIVRKAVDPGQYEGVRGLIVGGSRGLGELLAKLLVAGGGQVHITYSESLDAARRTQEALTPERCGLSQLDVTQADAGAYAALIEQTQPTHIFYMATPFIFASQKGRISQEKLERFMRFYLTSFLDLTQSALAAGVLNLFAPSSVAVEELPDAMAEYVIAKTAFEGACRYLTAENADLNLAYPRLPRVSTDQTANISGTASEDALPIMAEQLSAFVTG